MASDPMQYFDAIIIAPLEEEFETALEVFGAVNNLSTATEVRFEVGFGRSGHRALLVQQSKMGRTAAIVSVVVEASHLHRPNTGFKALISENILALRQQPACHLVVISLA